MSGISLDELVDLQITDGTDTLAINGDGSINATVTATDFDIRDLTAATDSVAVGDGINNLSILEEDAAAAGGEFGLMPLGIRQDAAGSPVSADGDYHPLVFNADGELKVAADLSSSVADDDADGGNPIKMGGRGVDGLLTALSASNDRYDLLGDMYRRTWVNSSANVGMTVGTETVGVTAVEVASTPLAGRRFVTIQNEGSVDVFMGHSNAVTTANGIKISKKSSATYELGEDIDIWLISGSAAQDVRILQAG